MCITKLVAWMSSSLQRQSNYSFNSVSQLGGINKPPTTQTQLKAPIKGADSVLKLPFPTIQRYEPGQIHQKAFPSERGKKIFKASVVNITNTFTNMNFN